ncbi:hypothetical protein JMUB7515_27920 [Staphylococcus aureus]
MNAIQNSISLRKILVVSLSILTILSMVLDFNFKEAQAQNKNNIADKNVETLNEKEIEKELKYIYGKIIILDKDLSLIHISEPTRLRCISYAVFCLKKHVLTLNKI